VQAVSEDTAEKTQWLGSIDAGTCHPLQERHWLEMRWHGVYKNSKNPDKKRRAVMRVPGAGQKIRPSLSRVKAG